jgi:molybdopterin biosynthesis enzyme
MVKAQGLIVLPREQTLARTGEAVKVILLDPSLFHLSGPHFLS